MSRCCSCSFLWGEKTTDEAKQMIMDALEKKKKLQIEVYFHKKTGPSCSTASPHHFPNKISRNIASRNGHSEELSHSKPGSFLSAGLATTITAAALGTTAFRKNKLLDYLHANQIQIAQVCPPRPIPVRFPLTPTVGADGLGEKHPLARLSRRPRKRSSLNKTDDIVPLTEEGSLSPCQNSLLDKSSITPARDLHLCEIGQRNDNRELKGPSVTNQTLLVSDSEDESVETTESDSGDTPSTTYKFQRRRSRAVLYQLSGRFDQKSKRKTPLKRFQRISGKEAIPEYKVQDVQASRFIILHYSLFKIVWDWMILICTFYIAVMVPYNAAFSLDTDGKDLLICDIIVELLFIIALMHAAVFGNVTTLIQRMYARRSAYQTKNQDLKDFTRAHHIPKPLKQRMLEFFQAMWAINQGIDKEAIMQSFPENVRGDIALHLNREMLSLPLFKSASPGCRKCLAQMITTRFATPGEYLVNRGDLLRNIFLVCSGSLEILGPEGTVVGLLGKCDIFGSDIDERPAIGFSAYDVKSLTYCELQCLALDSKLLDLLNEYPTFRHEFAASLHEELSFNIREGFDSSAASEILPAITLRPEQAEFCSIDGETDEKSDIEVQKADEENSGESVQRILHSCLVQTNKSAPCSDHPTRTNGSPISVTTLSCEKESSSMTNTISLEPEFSQHLDFIDSQTPNHVPLLEAAPTTPVWRNKPDNRERIANYNLLSMNQTPVRTQSCPVLSTIKQAEGEHQSNLFFSGDRFTNHCQKSSDFSDTFRTVAPCTDSSIRHYDYTDSMHQFLCNIQQELCTVRTEIQWITKHIISVQDRMNKLEFKNKASMKSLRTVRSFPSQSPVLRSPGYSETTTCVHYIHDDLCEPYNDPLHNQISSDEPVFSDTSPTEKFLTTGQGSILFNSSHLDSPRQPNDHKVVKFQLPPRGKLSKQHSSHSTTRNRHSPNRQLHERGRIQSSDSDTALARLGTPPKRLENPASVRPN
ncbi:Potassium voltage-gated channel subfamily H member 8 [Fasciola gigantica]|uniref:Potassium voltage-gated channel subfamily H member 8 n=1 Tax=Fasciola gigantica TaxID=46835 RepID=A0A504YEY7_FASGI|nr:Potassium voltage-gated channel subfamily H member 8 [Fasciola gigantica]